MEKFKKIYIFGGIFVAVFISLLIYILVLIWMPKNNIEINRYDTIDYENATKEYYINKLKELLNPNNDISNLYSITEGGFLESNSINNQESLKSFLISKRILNTNLNFTEYNVFKKDDTNIYRFKYRSNGFDRIVNVIETQPYIYTLSFEQETLPIVMNNTYFENINNIEFTIKTLNITEKSIKYQINIVNNSTDDLIFDFSNISNVLLLMNDNSTIKMAAAIASSDNDGVLPKNSIINEEAYFSIDIKNQSNIKGIIFKDTIVGNVTKDLQILF